MIKKLLQVNVLLLSTLIVVAFIASINLYKSYVTKTETAKTANTEMSVSQFTDCDTDEEKISLSKIVLTCPYTSAFHIEPQNPDTPNVEEVTIIMQKFKKKLDGNYPHITVTIYNDPKISPGESTEMWVKKELLTTTSLKEANLRTDIHGGEEVVKWMDVGGNLVVSNYLVRKKLKVKSGETEVMVSFRNVNTGMCDESCSIEQAEFIYPMIFALVF